MFQVDEKFIHLFFCFTGHRCLDGRLHGLHLRGPDRVHRRQLLVAAKKVCPDCRLIFETTKIETIWQQEISE
jgi:hypothetical protein